MAKRTKRSRYATAFGAALDEQLARRRLAQNDLAVSVGRSPTYVSNLIAGRKNAGPKWADLIADALSLPDEEREKLHIAAATDSGYKVDLTKRGKP